MSEAAVAAPAAVESTTAAQPGQAGQVAAAVADSGAKPAPSQDGVKMYTVKVNGQERQVTEAELLAGYSHGSAAQEKMREAQEQRKMAEEVLRIFKTNPKEAFAKLGVDVKTFAEQVLNEHLEESMLTPEQKELRDLRAMQKQIQEREAAAKAEQARAAEEAYREQVGKELNLAITNALSTSGLPRNEYTVGRIAFYMDSAVRAGYDLPVPDLLNQIVPLVKDEYNKEVQSLIASTPEDKLLELLGEDFTKKTVKAHLAKVKAKSPTKLVKPEDQPKQDTTGTKPIKSPKEFFKRSWQK